MSLHTIKSNKDLYEPIQKLSRFIYKKSKSNIIISRILFFNIDTLSSQIESNIESQMTLGGSDIKVEKIDYNPTFQNVYENPIYENPIYENPIYENPIYENPIYENPINETS